MNNQKVCFYCHSGTKYMPITNKKGEIISLHSICQNPNCSVNLTMLALKKRKSTLNLKKRIKPTQKKSRLGKGLAVGLVSAVSMFYACTSLAQIDTSVVYTASSTPRQVSRIDVERTETINPVSESIHDKLTRYALKYDIPRQELWQLVGCETGYQWDANMQSKAIYTFDDPKHGIVKGTQEKSYGLAMLHAPVHTELTMSQIKDADFALDWIGKHWGERKQLWKNCTEWHDL